MINHWVEQIYITTWYTIQLSLFPTILYHFILYFEVFHPDSSSSRFLMMMFFLFLKFLNYPVLNGDLEIMSVNMVMRRIPKVMLVSGLLELRWKNGMMLWPELHPSSLHEQYSIKTENVPDLLMHAAPADSSSIQPQLRMTRGTEFSSTIYTKRQSIIIRSSWSDVRFTSCHQLIESGFYLTSGMMVIIIISIMDKWHQQLLFVESDSFWIPSEWYNIYHPGIVCIMLSRGKITWSNEEMRKREVNEKNIQANVRRRDKMWQEKREEEISFYSKKKIHLFFVLIKTDRLQ